MKFIVIGITDHPQPWFPPEVLDIIRAGKVFSGGRRHHELVAHLLPADAEWIDITVPLDAVFEQYASHFSLLPPSASAITVFASGDPLFFGFANTIRRKLPDAHIVVYPTFNALQMLAHRLVMPYHDMRTVSLTGRPWPELDRALIEHAGKIGVLTDREHTPAVIASRLLDYGYGYYRMSVGEHLGNPGLERITTLSLAEAATRDFKHPNCIILERQPADSCHDFRGGILACQPYHRPFGIPDNEFVLLDGREKMITKMPIRLLTLQALGLPRRHVLWDIGFCTGSVSIEARLQFPHLRIEAFEIRPACEAIIHENMLRHGAPGIGVHIGDFRTVNCNDMVTSATDCAAPDAVFIGGHGGHLREIMAKVLDYLTPDGIIVMNSVSSPMVPVDSHQLWDDACRELGLRQEPPLRIQLNDYNPIEILSASRK